MTYRLNLQAGLDKRKKTGKLFDSNDWENYVYFDRYSFGSCIPTLREDNKISANFAASFGDLNNTYIIPTKVSPIFMGHFIASGKTNWTGIENFVKEIIPDTYDSGTSATRNWDLNRTVTFLDGRQYIQKIEVKKTTGNGIRDYPPTFIKSSVKQLKSLAHKKDYVNQVFPSLYIIVSVDYNKTIKSYVHTVWAVTVKDHEDFTVVDTSNQNITRRDLNESWVIMR